MSKWFSFFFKQAMGKKNPQNSVSSSPAVAPQLPNPPRTHTHTRAHAPFFFFAFVYKFRQ